MTQTKAWGLRKPLVSVGRGNTEQDRGDRGASGRRRPGFGGLH